MHDALGFGMFRRWLFAGEGRNHTCSLLFESIDTRERPMKVGIVGCGFVGATAAVASFARGSGGMPVGLAVTAKKS